MTHETLKLFRAFVLQNVTSWNGGGTHHHPMWGMVAEALGDAPDVKSGPEYHFIQPDNREPLDSLREIVR